MLSLTCPLGERTQAFEGLLAVVNHSPALLVGNRKHVVAFVTACCTAWCEEEEEASRPAHVMGGVRDFLQRLRGHDAALWQQVMRKFSAAQADMLQQLFHL